MTLPHEEVIEGADGSIVHWDVKKDSATDLSNFSITTSNGEVIDHASENILNEILSLRHEVVNFILFVYSKSFKFVFYLGKVSKK